jgi:ketosteroid isomerase-like protein
MSDTQSFLREFNEYWVREDSQAILDAVTDDIRFGMVGGKAVSGKAEFEEFLSHMSGGGSDMSVSIANIIVDGDRAAVNGEISMTDKDGQRKIYGFCDVYRLEGSKVAELTAYVLDVNGDNAGGAA